MSVSFFPLKSADSLGFGIHFIRYENSHCFSIINVLPFTTVTEPIYLVLVFASIDKPNHSITSCSLGENSMHIALLKLVTYQFMYLFYLCRNYFFSIGYIGQPRFNPAILHRTNGCRIFPSGSWNQLHGLI